MNKKNVLKNAKTITGKVTTNTIQSKPKTNTGIPVPLNDKKILTKSPKKNVNKQPLKTAQRTHKRMNTLTSINTDKKINELPKERDNKYNKGIKTDSVNRLNEYSELFGMINNAVVDLKSSINELLATNDRRSFVHTNLSIIKENFGFIHNNVITEEECDFSETHMYEGVEVKPILYGSKTKCDESINIQVDKTYIEYESILTVENDLVKQNKHNLLYFNEAKTNLQNSAENSLDGIVIHLDDKNFSDENTNSTAVRVTNPKESERCVII
jgi:hypothetical protein